MTAEHLAIIPMVRGKSLIGAAEWVGKIKTALDDQSAAEVGQRATVAGQGGIGKTAMAIEYAYAQVDDYPGGIFWLQADLGLAEAIPRLDGELCLRGLSLGLREGQTEGKMVLAFRRFLADREKSLVILDNVEDPYLPERLGLPATHILVTTRRQDLALTSVTMDLPDDAQALAILLTYAAKKWESLSDSERTAAKVIRHRAGNLPLALEILGNLARTEGLINVASWGDEIFKKKGRTTTRGIVSIAEVLGLMEPSYGHPLAKRIIPFLGYLHPENISTEVLRLVMDPEGKEIKSEEMAQALSSLAKISVVQARAEGGYAVHLLTHDAARELDQEQAAGKQTAAVFDAVVKKVSGKGHYSQGYNLIPHLIHLSQMAKENTPEDAFPPAPLTARWATFLSYSGLPGVGEKIYWICLARVKDSKGENHPDFAINLNNLAAALRGQGEYAKAESLYRKALEIGKKNIEDGYPDYSITLNNLAGVMRELGKYAEAEQLYRQALEIDDLTIGQEHPEYAKHLNNLAAALMALGKYAEAENLFREALEIDARTIGREHPGYAVDLNNLALALGKQNKHAEAERLYRQALEIDAKTLGEGHPGYARHLNNLGAGLWQQGKSPEAEIFFRQALGIDAKSFGQNHPSYAVDLNNLAGSLADQGKYDEAEPLLVQAEAIFVRSLGPEHPDTKLVQRSLAACQAAIAKGDQAR